IAFKITDYALLLVGLGFTTMLVAGRRVLKDVGQAVLGLGLMFLGLKVILEGSSPLTSNPLASQLLSVLTDNTLLAVIVAGPFTALVASTATDSARQIANAHTLFNVGMSLAFLPFAPLAARAIEALVADDEVGENPFKTRYLDERSLDQPSLALGQATREAL